MCFFTSDQQHQRVSEPGEIEWRLSYYWYHFVLSHSMPAIYIYIYTEKLCYICLSLWPCITVDNFCRIYFFHTILLWIDQMKWKGLLQNLLQVLVFSFLRFIRHNTLQCNLCMHGTCHCTTAEKGQLYWSLLFIYPSLLVITNPEDCTLATVSSEWKFVS